MYDYLIVGAGLFGAVFAHEMTAKGKKCLVIDKRAHIGGNCLFYERRIITNKIICKAITYYPCITICICMRQTEYTGYDKAYLIVFLVLLYQIFVLFNFYQEPFFQE